MQRETSIGSRITWFVIAAITLVATCLMGLRVLPVFAGVFTEFGMKPAILTQAVLTFGPAVLVSVGASTALIMVMGEFTPALRRMRTALVLLVVAVMGFSVAAVLMASRFNCCEADAPTPVFTPATQSTNAP